MKVKITCIHHKCKGSERLKSRLVNIFKGNFFTSQLSLNWNHLEQWTCHFESESIIELWSFLNKSLIRKCPKVKGFLILKNICLVLYTWYIKLFNFDLKWLIYTRDCLLFHDEPYLLNKYVLKIIFTAGRLHLLNQSLTLQKVLKGVVKWCQNENKVDA